MKKITLSDLFDLKKSSVPIACLTAYDSTQANFFESCGLEVLLVGDSLGMTVKGEENTVSTTVKDVLYHTKCITRNSRKSYVIADMPFLSYINVNTALKNASKFIQDGLAKMVKVEGCSDTTLEVISFLIKNHIPVCGHLGLSPQSILETGKYKVENNNEESLTRLKKEMKKIEATGAPMVVLECIPHAITKELVKRTNLIVIGIGSGNSTDGQILVHYDLMGMSKRKIKFARDFLSNLKDDEFKVSSDSKMALAIKHYVKSVKDRSFPDLSESF